MNAKLSEKRARLHIIIIGMFYLISGVWEYLVGLTQAESIGSGKYFLLDVYRNYAIILGLGTIIVGIVFLFKVKIARLLALTLAWWNLFTAPLLDIWWNIYAISIKKFLITDSWRDLWIASAVLITIMTLIRFYIIYMLRVSKAGYVFFKKR